MCSFALSENGYESKVSMCSRYGKGGGRENTANISFFLSFNKREMAGKRGRMRSFA